MIKFKGIFLVFYFFCLGFQWNALGMLDSKHSLEPKTNFEFISQTFSKEGDIPVLFVEVGEGYCIIPLDNQGFKNWIPEGKKQNDRIIENFGDQLESLKECQPELSQLVLDSLQKKGNSIAAGVFAFIGGGLVYGGLCSYASIRAREKQRADYLWDLNEPSYKVIIRAGLAVVCAPVYIIHYMIYDEFAI